MRIGAFLKQSFIDYPGEVASVIFTKGCNFRCSYCHNPSLVLPSLLEEQADIAFEEVLAYLIKRKNLLTGLVLTGGEPTLQKDLAERLSILRKDTQLKIKLDTNASKPEVLELLLKNKLLDYVAMDIKHRLTEDDYKKSIRVTTPGLIEKIQQSIALLQEHKVKHEYRLTIAPEFISVGEIGETLACLPGTDPIYLQKVRKGNNLEQQQVSSFSDDELCVLLLNERVRIR